MAGNKDSTSQPGPPSYDTLYHPTPAASNAPGEDITAPREGSPRLALDPPLPQRTPFKTAEAAAMTALRGTAMAFLHTDPAVVAAQTACAIAVAVSTSRSYTAFVAAITAAESAALIFAESQHHHIPEDHIFQRAKDAIRRAAEAAVAVDAGNTPASGSPSDRRNSV